MRKREEEQGAKLVRYASSVLLGAVAAVAVCAAFLLLTSVGISAGWLREALMDRLIIAGCVIGSFTGALLAVARCGSRALPIGLSVGAAMFLILLTVGVVFFETRAPGIRGAGILCGTLCGGAAAGLIKKSRSKRRKG